MLCQRQPTKGIRSDKNVPPPPSPAVVHQMRQKSPKRSITCAAKASASARSTYCDTMHQTPNFSVGNRFKDDKKPTFSDSDFDMFDSPKDHG